MNYCNFSSSLGCSENKQIKMKSNTCKRELFRVIIFHTNTFGQEKDLPLKVYHQKTKKKPVKDWD